MALATESSQRLRPTARVLTVRGWNGGLRWVCSCDGSLRITADTTRNGVVLWVQTDDYDIACAVEEAIEDVLTRRRLSRELDRIFAPRRRSDRLRAA